MKLVFRGLCVLLFMMTLSPTVGADVIQTQGDLVICHEEEVGKTQLVDGKIYVPLDATLEAMGFTVAWHAKAQAIVVKNDYLTTEYNGWKVANINGFKRKFDDALTIIGGKTYISLDMLYQSTNLKATAYEDKIFISEEDNYDNFSFITDKQRVTILMYHHILSDKNKKEGGWSKNGAVNTTESFDQQMKYIGDQGYNTISVKALEAFIYQKKPLAASSQNNSILLTFDDGYLSNYINAYPLMKKYGLRGVVFHETACTPDQSIEKLDIHKIDRISLEQMDLMSDVFEHEMHTHKGHDKVNAVADMIWMNKEEMVEDLKENQRALPKYSSKSYFAYPFGMYDNETIEALKAVGVKLAFTTQGGYTTLKSEPYELNRFGVFPWISFSKFKNYIDQ